MKHLNIRLVTVLFFLLFIHQLKAQDNSEESIKEKSKIKKGWTFGVLPSVAFNTDIGFQYGILTNFYNYGDGSTYPKYLQSIFLEFARTTKGSGINRFYFDSDQIIPNIRLTADVSYLTEKAMQFFGFNGYDAVYNSTWEDDTDPEYV